MKNGISLGAGLALMFAIGSAQARDIIVSLQGVGGPESAAQNLAYANDFLADFGITPSFVYGAVFTGFAATVTEVQYGLLALDNRVISISDDGTVYAAAKGGKGGGGGGGGDDGCHPKKGCSGGGGGDGGGDPPPPEPTQTVPWGVERIGAHLNANTGAGVELYVFDTGVDAGHPDIAANLGTGYAASDCKGRGCLAPWHDKNGHGTHVAGIAAAIDNDIDVVGVAPAATVHPVKVLSEDSVGKFSEVVAGLDWVVARTIAAGTASVANLSLSGVGSKTGNCYISGYLGTDNFHRAFCEAKNAGVVIVVSAGNESVDAASRVPASYDDAVIAVSASNPGDDWAIYSNYGEGSNANGGASGAITIGAPGTAVESLALGGGTRSDSGTSMAAPHVAGTVALFLASQPQRTNGSAYQNTLAALLGSAEDTSGFANTSGQPHNEKLINAATH